MTIALFGATGRTGLHLLKKSLESGYRVRALVRNPDKLAVNHENLEVIPGNLLDASSVARTIAGCDAVLSAAGPVKGADPAFLVEAVTNVIEGMTSSGIKRLIWLTGAGVIDPRDGRDAMRPLIRGVMKLVAGKVLASSEKAYRLIVESDLDYTVVRAPMLSDGEAGQELTAGYTPPRPRPVSRADLATYMLSCLSGKTQVRESPMVGLGG